MTYRSLLATASILALISAGAEARSISHDSLTLYGGVFDVLNDADAAQFGAEYRFTLKNSQFKPTLGFNFDTDGAIYGYAGVNWELPLYSDKLYFIPNFMVGYYTENGGKDLGGEVEFRSGIELAYQFPSRSRLGVAFNHISNASIYDRNPGAETLLLTYTIPMGVLLGGRK